jgi:hypothetical protein
MKRNRFFPFLLSVLVTVFLFSGCYTQVTIRQPRQDKADYPEYTEAYSDSSGTVINNYYDTYAHPGMFFQYYYPYRSSFAWSPYYDPYWDWCYSPFWYYPYWSSGWYYGSSYNHGWYGSGGWSHRNLDNVQGSRTRTSGPMRTRDLSRTSGVTTTATSSPTRQNLAPAFRSGSTQAIQRVATRINTLNNSTVQQRNATRNTPTNRFREAASSRSRSTAAPSSGRYQSSGSSNVPSRNYTPPASSGSGDRGSSGRSGSDGGGSRSRGSSGGSSSGGSSGGSNSGGGSRGGSRSR